MLEKAQFKNHFRESDSPCACAQHHRGAINCVTGKNTHSNVCPHEVSEDFFTQLLCCCAGSASGEATYHSHDYDHHLHDHALRHTLLPFPGFLPNNIDGVSCTTTYDGASLRLQDAIEQIDAPIRVTKRKGLADEQNIGMHTSLMKGALPLM